MAVVERVHCLELETIERKCVVGNQFGPVGTHGYQCGASGGCLGGRRSPCGVVIVVVVIGGVEGPLALAALHDEPNHD